MKEDNILNVEIFKFSELVQLASSIGGDAACLARFMHSLGPAGCGLLAVRDVPFLVALRAALLPLARFLALLPPLERSVILKEHGLGTDVSLKDPHRLVSSFAAQLCFGGDHDCIDLVQTHEINAQTGSTCGQVNDIVENGLQQFGHLFRKLAKVMVDVGLLVARICDIALPGVRLEAAILESYSAKGRLIHYHSVAERLLLEACQPSSARRGKRVESVKRGSAPSVDNALSCRELWQQWHFDYGILTVLTVPLFVSGGEMDSMHEGAAFSPSPSCNIRSSASGTSTAEWDASSEHIGLKVLNAGHGCVENVHAPPDCLLVQVGEVAQLLTAGKLQATAHCVCRPLERSDVSRETFVVFLQPAWNKQLCWPNPAPRAHAGKHNCLEQTDIISRHASNFDKDLQEILGVVPPLESRWRNGFTFAEFSKETTKQYYGANGAQTKR